MYSLFCFREKHGTCSSPQCLLTFGDQLESLLVVRIHLQSQMSTDHSKHELCDESLIVAHKTNEKIKTYNACLKEIFV